VRYPEFNYFVREAYGLEPMARTGSVASKLQCELGLVQVSFDASKKMVPGNYISLRKVDDHHYRTSTPIRIGSKFKAEVKNNNECFIYIFGMETDGSAYTLFPYPMKDDPSKTKYSAFFGITGYRLFPRDASMTPDSIGSRDMLAILVSKKELDWNAIRKSINSQSASADWTQKIKKAIPGAPATDINFTTTAKGNISFAAEVSDKEVVYCIVEFDKQR
jgi:hypothetical protein